MGTIFISYAREDADIAKKLYQDIKKAGGQPWLDTENLLPGQEWEVEINREIAHCSFFIALISRNSVSKLGLVQKELRRALDTLEEVPPGRIFLIPARLDQSSPTHEKLSKIQWVDLFPSYKQGFSRLLQSLGLNPIHEVIKAESRVSPSETLPGAIPADVLEIIRAKAERDFPNDFSAISYVIKQQRQAWHNLQKFTHSDVPIDVFRVIIAKATKDFPDDFSTRLYQIERELKAWHMLNSLEVSGIPTEVLSTIIDKAKRDFPEDFSTRFYSIQREIESWRKLYGGV